MRAHVITNMELKDILGVTIGIIFAGIGLAAALFVVFGLLKAGIDKVKNNKS